MQMSDAVEVVQVAGATNANKRLAEGWTLLAVVSNANAQGTAHVAYVLGKGPSTRLTTSTEAQLNTKNR